MGSVKTGALTGPGFISGFTWAPQERTNRAKPGNRLRKARLQ
jgi:hypothetical protein